VDERVRPTVAQVDLAAVRHNCAVLRSLLRPGVEHLAVVKADAYGHGDVRVARACVQAGVDRLGVALVEEGVRLRRSGVEAPVLVLGEVTASGARPAVVHGLTATVCSTEAVTALAEAARAHGRKTPVHVCVDTGMRREGVDPDGLVELAAAVAGCEGLEFEGVWTHLATADEPEHPATGRQLRLFAELLERLDGEGLRPPIAHAANSAATMLLPEAQFDLVRTGVAVYGLAPARVLRGDPRLRPAMRLVSRVASVRRVRARDSVAYGHTWAPESDTDVALVPIGYGDGFPRLLSNNGVVLVRGSRRAVVGRVSMDQILLDCGRDGVEAGDEAVVIGRQQDEEITADELADRAGTINYEIVTAIGPRVPREYSE
jgi:alanine racemase